MALNISSHSKREDDSLLSNYLHLKFKGDSINHVLINSIRRIILEDIPGFAFDIDKINIKSNTSVYNNDYIKNRIENFPIFGLDNSFDINECAELRKNYIEKVDNIESNMEDIDEIKPEIVEMEMDEEEKKRIEMDAIKNMNALNFYLYKENSSDEILNVTTDDCEFFLKGDKKKNIYKNPLLICKLKKGEKIELSAIAKKDIPSRHIKYCVAGVCCFEQINDNEFIFKVENRNQYTNLKIVEISCEILVFRLNELLDKIMNEKFTTENHGKIILQKENHTMGNLLSRLLQDNANIDFAAYKLDHLLIDDVTIEYITNGSKSINEIINLAIKKQISVIDEVRDKIKKIK